VARDPSTALVLTGTARSRQGPRSLTCAQWLEDRRAELLPVECFHVAFTVPQQIEAIAYQNMALLYDMLFKARAQTLAHDRRRCEAPGC
jgi:hypothetical protein